MVIRQNGFRRKGFRRNGHTPSDGTYRYWTGKWYSLCTWVYMIRLTDLLLKEGTMPFWNPISLNKWSKKMLPDHKKIETKTIFTEKLLYCIIVTEWLCSISSHELCELLVKINPFSKCFFLKTSIMIENNLILIIINFILHLDNNFFINHLNKSRGTIHVYRC
jgi:hypothetical protein